MPLLEANKECLRKVQSHTGIAVLSVMLTLKGVLWIVPIAYIKRPATLLSHRIS